jgi:hypothetical protein
MTDDDAGRHGGSHPPPVQTPVPVGAAPPAVAAEALDRLRRAGIPAYVKATDEQNAAGVLFVDRADVDDARTVLGTLGSAVRTVDSATAEQIGAQNGGPANGPGGSASSGPAGGSAESGADAGGLALAPREDPDDRDFRAGTSYGRDDGFAGAPEPSSAGDDIDEEFARLISQLDIDGTGGLNGADGPTGQDLAANDAPASRRSDQRSAAEPLADAIADEVSRRLGAPDDPPELREEHFVRPAPPPFPRPSRGGALAVLVVVFGIAILAFGGLVGLTPDESLTFGILCTLAGALLLGRRLKRHHDDGDDGAVV